MASASRSRIIFVLGFGLLAISTSSVFIKLAAAPALTITFYRVGLASLFYYLVARRRGPIGKLFDRRQRVLALLSGLALSLHFITWISSLNYTSVASSVVLVVTSPIWVALGSFLFLKEKPSKRVLLGIIITFTGSLIISGADFSVDPSRLFGNLLAVAGAIFVSIYLVIGRGVRESIDTFPYVAVVYGVAAVSTFFFILLNGAPIFGFEPRTYLFLFIIAFFPQIIGHTSYNWALKYFSATAVALVSLGEPVGASFFAWLILGQKITLMQFFGGLVILAGLILSLTAESRQKEKDEHLQK